MKRLKEGGYVGNQDKEEVNYKDTGLIIDLNSHYLRTHLENTEVCQVREACVFAGDNFEH